VPLDLRGQKPRPDECSSDGPSAEAKHWEQYWPKASAWKGSNIMSKRMKRFGTIF